MNNPIQCEQCEKVNSVNYTIAQGSSTTTCIGWMPTFDRNGTLLNKDPNETTTNYYCSNGHSFLIKE